jgi:hypothetical protein
MNRIFAILIGFLAGRAAIGSRTVDAASHN